jgi:hypothetical protein
LHPHLKDRAGGRQGNKKKQQFSARRAEAADGGSSEGPSGAQLQEMFAAFMLTQNLSAPGPRREDSYIGSVVELKVPVTPMSNTNQTRIRAGATPWRSKTLQARVAATTLTCKGPERQRLAGPQSNMPFGYPQYQGIQGFRFGDFEEEFPALGGRKNTTSGISKGAEKGPTDDMDIVKEPVGGNQPGSNLAPSSTGKAPEDTPAVESVSHPPAPISFAEAPEAPVQQRSLPVPHSNIRRFDAGDMSDAGPSVPKMRTIRLPGEQRNVMVDQVLLDWSAADTNLYNRPGVQMTLGGQMTQGIRDYVGPSAVQLALRH